MVVNIFDSFLTRKRSDFLLTSSFVESMQAKVRKARRFIFNVEASRRTAEVIKTIPDLIARESAFARAPFDLCWIELDFPSYWEELTSESTSMIADQRIALFIDHDSAIIIAAGESGPNHGIQITPFEYVLHTPWELQDQLEFANLLSASRIGIDRFLWGSTYDLLNQTDQRALRSVHSCRLLPLKAPELTINAILENKTALESVGELKLIVSLLLMLNRPSVTQYKEIPASRGYIRGKLRPYMSHTVVSINIDPVPVLRQIGTPAGEGIERRRHEVRGHWRHDETYRIGTKKECVHDWAQSVQYPDEYHFTCKHCQGDRWWVRHHMRGSALEGFVIHDGYEAAP